MAIKRTASHKRGRDYRLGWLIDPGPPTSEGIPSSLNGPRIHLASATEAFSVELYGFHYPWQLVAESLDSLK